MTDAKHTRTYTRTCVCKKKNKSRGEFRVVIGSKLVYRSVLGFKHVYPVEQMNRITKSQVHYM